MYLYDNLGVSSIESSDIVVFYHKNCPDGCTAAWVVGLAHEDDSLCSVPVMHCEMGVDDDRVEACAGKVVYMVDTYQERATLEKIKSVAKSVMVIDHHVTGQSECDGFDGYVYSDCACGAKMAWEMFFGTEPPALVRYVNDMDLWENKLKDTKEIQMVLRGMRSPEDAGKLSQRMEFARDMLVATGKKKLTRMNKKISSACKDAQFGTINGIDFVCFESRAFRDDIGMALAEKFGMPACVWSWQGTQFTYSLRSTGARVDAVAEVYGGGGHPNAAGFASEDQVIIDRIGREMESSTKISQDMPPVVNTRDNTSRQKSLFGGGWRSRVYGGKR